ncbi:hypothetical protein [Winogradskyella sp.]|uniref:hypothetical protein n=1 Tax=Winogradskyella sp. TaxID=1883156 RepID=UPI0025E51569|nr:hypothetical protein [Winogradskyella sp.]MBT8246111.1 hypothetical protein [Winogradskyella sp.]
MVKKLIFLLIHIALAFQNHAQKVDNLVFKNGIDNPNMQTVHHFRIFSSRIRQNFKIRPSKNKSLSFNYASGNNFQPFDETHLTKNPALREVLNQVT